MAVALHMKVGGGICEDHARVGLVEVGLFFVYLIMVFFSSVGTWGA